MYLSVPEYQENWSSSDSSSSSSSDDYESYEESLYSYGLSTIVEETSIDLRSLSTLSLLRRKRKGLIPPTRRPSMEYYGQALAIGHASRRPGGRDQEQQEEEKSPVTPRTRNVQIHSDYEIHLEMDRIINGSNQNDNFRRPPMPLSDDEFTFETCSFDIDSDYEEESDYELDSDCEVDEDEDDDELAILMAISRSTAKRQNRIEMQAIHKFDACFLQCRKKYQGRHHSFMVQTLERLDGSVRERNFKSCLLLMKAKLKRILLKKKVSLMEQRLARLGSDLGMELPAAKDRRAKPVKDQRSKLRITPRRNKIASCSA